jgi:hypothetical protein
VFEPRGGSQLHALTFSFHHETARLWPKRDRWFSMAFSQVIQGRRCHGDLARLLYGMFKRRHKDAEKDDFKITP